MPPARWQPWYNRRRFRVRTAWVLFWVAVVGCPVNLLLSPDEPRSVLLLSWFAIALTAWDVIGTSELREGD